jgi:hypothetical protein
MILVLSSGSLQVLALKKNKKKRNTELMLVLLVLALTQLVLRGGLILVFLGIRLMV